MKSYHRLQSLERQNKNAYTDMIFASEHKAIDSRQMVEVSYLWDPPTLNSISVRCATQVFKEDNGVYYLRGHHQNLSTLTYLNQNMKICSVGFLMLDLYYFKFINDVFGHYTGALILKETGRLVTEFMCQKSFAYRMGRDEFTIFISDVDDEPKLLDKVKALCEKVHFLNTSIEKNITTSFSVGLTIKSTLNNDSLLFINTQMIVCILPKTKLRMVFRLIKTSAKNKPFF